MSDTLVETLKRAAQSENTKRTYDKALAHFLAWGGSIPVAENVLESYIAETSQTRKVATLELRLAAISNAHRDKGYPSPLTSNIKTLMRGIRRTNGSAQRRVNALVKDDLIEVLTLSDSQSQNKAVRDKALLLIGFAGAFRRSELVGICIEHLNFADAGVEVLLPRSKTDQEGLGRTVFIPYARGERCPVKALQSWLDLAGIESGAVFRRVTRHDHIGGVLTAQSVALIVKEAVRRSKPNAVHLFSGHSLRAGFVTQAAMAGLQSWQIKEVSGHRSDVVLSRYIRPVQRRKIPSLL
jgi:integrase